MSFVSANTVSFNSSEIDFLGIYKVLKQALLQASADSPRMVTALESAAQTRLGMSLTDALSLATGEISSVQNSAALDDSQQIRIHGDSQQAGCTEIACARSREIRSPPSAT